MAPPRTRPRNIVVMVLDSLRYDGTGFSQDRRFHDRFGLKLERRTPTLDRLARSGAVFTRAFSTASYTTSAHAAMFTSRYPAEHQVLTMNPMPLAPGLPTLAGLLSEAGYHTVHAVDFEAPFVDSDLNRGARQVFFHDDRRVLELLARRKEGVYLFAHFGDLHAPYLRSFGDVPASKAYHDAYAALRRRYRMPEIDAGFRQSVAFSRANHWSSHQRLPRWVMDDFSTLKIAMQLEGQYFRAIYPYYQQGINQFDQGRLAAFVSALEQIGFLEDSLLVITSDHGEANFSDNHFDHGIDLSDGVLQVPLLFRYPGLVPSGSRIDTPVNHLDVAPTVLKLAGVPLERTGMRGTSLVDAMTGRGELVPDRGLYAENWRSVAAPPGSPAGTQRMLAYRAIRTDRLKLVIQGRDLVGDEQVLSLVAPDLELDQFIQTVDHRYLGLANHQPLTAWIKAHQQMESGADVLTDVLSLARSTMGQERYRTQHMRRLRSYAADRLQQHTRGGTLDVSSLVRDLFEAWFLEFPPEAMVQKLSVLVRHHCRGVDDILGLFEQLGSPRERYCLYDLDQDPFEELNLFGSALSIPQERDALALEIMLMEAFYKGRSAGEVWKEEPPRVQSRGPTLTALG